MSRWLLIAVTLAASPTLATGQMLRGVVTERSSGTPVVGVVVTLEAAAGGGGPVSVLSNERGEFAIRAPRPGQYRINAKRIGVQRFVSGPFQLGEGETRRFDVTVEALAYALPEVRVAETTSGLCLLRAGQRSRVVSLWDEARTVLTAARISLRDRLFEGQLTRYSRGLDPRNLRVLEESWAEMQGVMDRPFFSLSGDSLSKVGYFRSVGDYTYYYAPDAEALLSEAFQRDHCFGAVDGGRDRRGLVGISFEPVPSRTLPDVRGTMWLDARTFELRFVEFRYTMMDVFAGSDRTGGEVHFSRLSNGAWVASRWFLRFPQFGVPMAPIGSQTRIPTVVVRPRLHRLIEEGGIVFTSGLRHFDRPASVTGVVLDSAGLPFGGATVRVGGAPYTTLAAGDGRFRIDSLPEGRFTLIAEHPSYALVGSYVVDQPVELREGATTEVTLRAIRTEDLVRRLCDDHLPKKDNATVRITVVDSVTSRPLPNLRVWLRWSGRFAGRGESLRPTEVGGLESLTSADGVVSFCDVPAGVSLWFSAVQATGRPTADSVAIQLEKNELKAWRVRTRRPG